MCVHISAASVPVEWEVVISEVFVCCHPSETCSPPRSPDMNLYCCSSEELTANSSRVTQIEAEPLEQLDITKYLVFRKPDEDGPDVRGGHPEALIIHATKANKNGELQFLDSITGVCPLYTKC